MFFVCATNALQVCYLFSCWFLCKLFLLSWLPASVYCCSLTCLLCSHFFYVPRGAEGAVMLIWLRYFAVFWLLWHFTPSSTRSTYFTFAFVVWNFYILISLTVVVVAVSIVAVVQCRCLYFSDFLPWLRLNTPPHLRSHSFSVNWVDFFTRCLRTPLSVRLPLSFLVRSFVCLSTSEWAAAAVGTNRPRPCLTYDSHLHSLCFVIGRQHSHTVGCLLPLPLVAFVFATNISFCCFFLLWLLHLSAQQVGV